MKWSFNYCSKALGKKWGKKNKKNCRVPAKKPLPSARSQGTRQRIFKKINKKPFVECLTAGHSAKADGRWPPSRRPPLPTAKFCRVPGTRQRFFCRRPIFAERPALGKGKFLPTAKVCRVSGSRQRQICRRPIFAECRWVRLSAKIAFAECPIESTRQISRVR